MTDDGWHEYETIRGKNLSPQCVQMPQGLSGFASEFCGMKGNIFAMTLGVAILPQLVDGRKQFGYHGRERREGLRDIMAEAIVNFDGRPERRGESSEER